MSSIKKIIDEKLFPGIVKYTTNRAHILALFFLWIALLCCGSFTAFELVGGNYTNGLSALVSCIILAQQIRHEQNAVDRHQEVLRHHENLKQHFSDLLHHPRKDAPSFSENEGAQ